MRKDFPAEAPLAFCVGHLSDTLLKLLACGLGKEIAAIENDGIQKDLIYFISWCHLGWLFFFELQGAGLAEYGGGWGGWGSGWTESH